MSPLCCYVDEKIEDMAVQPGREEEKKDMTLTVVLTEQLQQERAPKQKKSISSLMLAKMIAGESLPMSLNSNRIAHFILYIDFICPLSLENKRRKKKTKAIATERQYIHLEVK